MNTANEIRNLEKVLESALEQARLVRSAVARQFDGAPSHPSIALIDLSVRAVSQANDAARWARHHLNVAVPQP